MTKAEVAKKEAEYFALEERIHENECGKIRDTIVAILGGAVDTTGVWGYVRNLHDFSPSHPEEAGCLAACFNVNAMACSARTNRFRIATHRSENAPIITIQYALYSAKLAIRAKDTLGQVGVVYRALVAFVECFLLRSTA